MRLDINIDDKAESHWMLSHGQLDEGAKNVVEAFKLMFEHKTGFERGLELVHKAMKPEDSDWVKVEMVLMLVVAFVTTRKPQ